MTGKIFVLNNNEELTELEPSQYSSEDLFQRLIEKHPEILAGDQITPENPRKWLFISSEMGVPAEQDGGSQWYLDHLFVDQDAIPTFIEVKRSTDTRIRREVVAQMLDYAANAVKYWPLDILQKSYTENFSEVNSLAAIGIALENEDAFWETVIVNLRAGRVRLIFAADLIPIELQRIIEYLNSQMRDTEVLGLEIKQFLSTDGLTTLVPSLVGKNASVLSNKRSDNKRMDEQTFLKKAEQTSGADVSVICEKLLRFFESLGCDMWWGRGEAASFIPGFGKTWHQFVAVFNTSRNTLFSLQFQYLKEPFNTDDYKQKMKAGFEKIPGVQIPEDKLSKRPSFPVELIVSDTSYDIFIGVIKSFIEDLIAFEGEK